MPEVSQGSSLLATLGFIAESLWDSHSLASIKIRVRCSADGRTPLLHGAPQDSMLYGLSRSDRQKLC